MKNIIRPKKLQFHRLNNDEYTNFLRNVEKLIQTASIEKLNIESEYYKLFQNNIGLLLSVSKNSKESHLTQELSLLDKERGDLVIFVLSIFRAERKNPNVDRNKAASYLFTETKSYSGMQNLPIGQQTNAIERFVLLLSGEVNKSHLTTLGLVDVVNKLSEINKKFQELSANRSESQLSKRKVNIQKIRKETYVQYQVLIEYAFATNLLQPSSESENFVLLSNKLIDDTNNAYKQRKSQVNSIEKLEKI